MKRSLLIVLLLAPLLASAGMSISPGTPPHTHTDANTGGAALSGTTCTNCTVSGTTTNSGTISGGTISGATITGGSVSATTTLPAATGASWVLLGSATASSSAALTFASTFSSSYDIYFFEIRALIPATTRTTLRVQVTEDNGSSYKAAGYYYVNNAVNSSAVALTPTTGRSVAFGQISESVEGILNGNGGYNGTLTVYSPASVTTHQMKYEAVSARGDLTDVLYQNGAVMYTTDTAAWTGIKFLMDSGNISAGTILVYGLKSN